MNRSFESKAARRPGCVLSTQDGISQTQRTVILIVLCVVFTLLTLDSLKNNCVTIDEAAHIPAGVSQWDRGRFSLYQENPPLVRSLVTLPVWLSSPRTTYARERIGVGERTEWIIAQDFINENHDTYWGLLFKARCVSLALGLLCGLLIYVWAAEMFGDPAALVCAALWMIDPNVMAHSGLATLDAGATFFGLAATYVFWKFLRSPSWLGACLSGLSLGLALASKFSMLALIPSWTGMALLGRWLSRGTEPSDNSPRPWVTGVQIVSALVLGLTVLNCCYGFEGSFTRLAHFRFVSSILGCGSSDRKTDVLGSNRFDGTILGKLPIPLPEPYVRSFDSQKHDEERKLARIDDGRLYRGGTWIGPLTTLARKLPPGSFLLLAVAGCAYLLRYCSIGAGVTLAALPAAVLFGLLCTQTGLNWAFRYSLPALPYLFLCVGPFVQKAWPTRTGRSLVLVCLVWNVQQLIIIRPDFLSYANFLAGGPDQAHRYFLGSNYDWGQDILRLKRWSDEHPGATPLVYACYGAIHPPLVGLKQTGLPEGPRSFGEGGLEFSPYYLAISTNLLHGLPSPVPSEMGRFLIRPLVCRKGWENLKPVARVGRSILIYHITSTDYDVYIGTRRIDPNDGATP